ncbi:hypothetical protein AURDEDRAFT_165784 [Auricularia subglabra TFB-10046 SS5]|nr:hypothetical protein AURDEDRAFT_165784 [Auricularia subglabra TFB-10046 SS5]
MLDAAIPPEVELNLCLPRAPPAGQFRARYSGSTRALTSAPVATAFTEPPPPTPVFRRAQATLLCSIHAVVSQ